MCGAPFTTCERGFTQRETDRERDGERERDRVDIIRARARDVAARTSDPQSDRCDSRSDTGRWRRVRETREKVR